MSKGREGETINLKYVVWQEKECARDAKGKRNLEKIMCQNVQCAWQEQGDYPEKTLWQEVECTLEEKNGRPGKDFVIGNGKCFGRKKIWKKIPRQELKCVREQTGKRYRKDIVIGMEVCVRKERKICKRSCQRKWNVLGKRRRENLKKSL